MKKIHINGNMIVDEFGNEVILKGANVNSPCILKYQEGHDVLSDIKELKKLGVNAVTVPICPAYFQARDKYCEELLDPIVNLCKELGLYCLLNWHGQGNPISGETRQPETLVEGYMKYDARPEIALKTAEILASRYGKEPYVMFEIISAIYLGVNGKEWHDFASSVIAKIRNFTDNIVVIGGMDWPQNLNALFNEEFSEQNIAFGLMVYPGSNLKDRQNLIELKKKHVIIITECGYEKTNPKEEMMASTKESYALPLKHFLFENKLSFFAWCYHPTRQPVMLNSWDPNDLSEWGVFVRDELLN